MKILLLGLFFLALISCSNPADKPTEKVQSTSVKQSNNAEKEINSFSSLRFFDHLKGKVKSITTSTFLAKNKGNEIIKVTLGNVYITSYDDKGNGIEKLYKNSTGNIQTRTTYISDASMKCVKATVYKSSNTLLKNLEFRYDSKGLLMEEKSIPSNGKLSTRISYIYNRLNQLVEEVKYNAVNNVETRTTYHYNSNNEIDETNYINPQKNSIIHCKSEYTNFDAHGNWLKCNQHTSKGSLFLIERQIEYYP